MLIFTNLKKQESSSKYIPLPHNRKIQKCITAFNIKIADRPDNQTRKFFTKLKPEIPLNVSNVVYKINCTNCDAVYIGESSQYLRIRINNQYNVKNREECTALSRYVIQKEHQFVNF